MQYVKLCSDNVLSWSNVIHLANLKLQTLKYYFCAQIQHNNILWHAC
jgi:hypothetical protein